ncbi:MAG: cell division protein FtsB [Burkholderiales bacterium]|nr:cell division protein FtsB [Burkholderiales bacterium]
MGSRLLPLVLLALLAAVHAQLWLGRGSVARVHEMQRQIDTQKAANARAAQENERLASEVQDLKEGLDMVEEKARSELGMVKPGEVFVQYTPAPPAR